ncbi:hypothetical protein C6497_01070 [Candidatus Poribacteria bacterium]|nr:MAG: hypothetical protein C6497_01070 [Candidatus Poribacteria bacterium]
MLRKFYIFVLILISIYFLGCSNDSKTVEWQQIDSGTEEHLFSVYFLDKKNGWISGDDGLVLSSSDRGNTWNQLGNKNGLTDTLTRVMFLTPKNGWLVSRGKIHYSSSGGTTWGIQHRIRSGSAKPPGILDLHFVNPAEGWAVGGTNEKGVSTILHTENGGTKWEKVVNPSDKHLWGVYFVDSSYGWVVGEMGEILHTRDSGKQWIRQISGVEQPLFKVHFTDLLNGWIVGTNGLIIHTIDGGNTWMHQPSNIKQSLRDVFFLNEQVGWAIGEEGLILHTMDGGKEWNLYPSPTTQNLQDIFFLNNTGWIVGEKGTILMGR